MTRSEALEQFQDKYCRETEGLTKEFIEGLKENTDEFMGRILEAFGEIADQAVEKEKTVCVFFLFSLLRYDLMHNKARVRLDVLDGGWFVDLEPLNTEFDLTFLFTPYFKWREKLLTDMREYMGKVNKYDVENIVQDKIMEAVRIFTQVLRILFRNIEIQENFARIPKTLFWEISFGEYRDYRELVMRVNRELRSEEGWIKKLEDYEENPSILQFSWWYRAELSKGDCQKKKMPYIVFEECTLKNIRFKRAEMTGARFLNCRLEHCDFSQADLSQAEFESCVFEECDFAGTRLKEAVFTPEGLDAEWFDDGQKEEMLITEGVEA